MLWLLSVVLFPWQYCVSERPFPPSPPWQYQRTPRRTEGIANVERGETEQLYKNHQGDGASSSRTGLCKRDLFRRKDFKTQNQHCHCDESLVYPLLPPSKLPEERWEALALPRAWPVAAGWCWLGLWRRCWGHHHVASTTPVLVL